MDSGEGTIAWSAVCSELSARLENAGISNAKAEARWLVEEASGVEAHEIASSNELATTKRLATLDEMAQRRLGGEPLQYVLGKWAFRSLELAVDRRALIPRPETEQLVTAALAALDAQGAKRPLVVDLGTGTGAIALSVASERTAAHVWATDNSSEALKLASANLAGLGRPATRVRLCEGRWFEALDDELKGSLHLVVSNPPYVAKSDEIEAVVSRWEPAEALFSSRDGYGDLEEICAHAAVWLAPTGALALEMAPHQVAVVAGRLEADGWRSVRTFSDLAGRDRGVVATNPQ